MRDKTIRHRIFELPVSACVHIAAEISQLIRGRAALGRDAVLGFPSGPASLPLYEELIYLYREEGLSFRNVISFHLDEFCGLEAGHPECRRSFIQQHFFDHIDIPSSNIHFLEGDLCEEEIVAHCEDYEQQIAAVGGIDLQILTIRRDGHIGFNQAGTPIHSRTARVRLDVATRTDAIADFGDVAKVPTHALTMGCGTVLDARRIVLIALGSKVARGVRHAVLGPVTPQFTGSFLRMHPAARVILDAAAATALRNPMFQAAKYDRKFPKKRPPSRDDGRVENF